MIENRHRIEKEILLGRQAVRASVQSRTRMLAPDSTEAGTVPSPLNGARLPRISLSPASVGSDVPLSVDTDVETAYANGGQSLFKRGRSIDMSTPRDSDQTANRDPLRSPLARRKWVSDLLDVKGSDAEGSENGYRNRTDAPHVPRPPFPEPNTQPASPGGFFTRFRTQSFPTLTSPFTTLRRNTRPGMEPRAIDHAWSSDSSSDDLVMDD